MARRQSLDIPNFGACLAALLLVCIPLTLFPDQGGAFLLAFYGIITDAFGTLYLGAGVAALVFVLWLALGRHGRVRLGDEGDRPEFSDLSWVAMLFCAGVGAGLMFWAPIEWAYYLTSPPFGAEPRSVAAAQWASTYGLFHWGPTAWAFYCLPALAIGYPYYVKKTPLLRLSTSCFYVLRGSEEGRTARFVDLLFMIGLLGGTGSSLGFSTPMIAACLARVTPLDNSFGLEVVVVVVSVALFATSVWLGLKKGIKRLSDLNLTLAFVLLGFVLVAGPTIFILKTSLSSVGLLLQEFVRMNTWTGSFTDSRFVEDWTIFYWAWWIAYAPFVGIFVTRISRGRTVRQIVFGMLGWGSLGGGLFYMILGNFGLRLELDERLAVTEMVADGQGPEAIVAILDHLPLAVVVTAVYALIALVFSATTYDSASYVLASVATRSLPAGEDPARWHRVFWAVALAVLPLTLMFIGDLRVIQTATLVVSLPLIFVGLLMAYSLYRQLERDHG